MATPQGLRFSHAYLYGGEPVADSSRMRLRLADACPASSDLHAFLQKELGVQVGPKGRSALDDYFGVDPRFFLKAELRDILDAVTLVFQFHAADPYRTDETWLEEARRIFREENIGYEINNQGGVRFRIDAAFSGAVAASISVLDKPRYANVRKNFEDAIRALDSVPPDAKAAIRGIFTAAEGLFRLMFPAAPRLGGAEVGQYLSPKIDSWLADATARHATGKLVASFKDWIDGAHFYRHEPGHEEPTSPPLEVAVLLINQGVGFIRWLAEMDTSHLAKG